MGGEKGGGGRGKMGSRRAGCVDERWRVMSIGFGLDKLDTNGVRRLERKPTGGEECYRI